MPASKGLRSAGCEAEFFVKADRLNLGAQVYPLQTGGAGRAPPAPGGPFHPAPGGGIHSAPPGDRYARRRAMPPGSGVHPCMPDKDMDSVPVLAVEIDAFRDSLFSGEDRITDAPDFGSEFAIECDYNCLTCQFQLPPKRIWCFLVLMLLEKACFLYPEGL